MKGFININKAAGKSSAQAVAAVKRLFQVPCGHMGTLDPMATGVLPVGLYKTTRLFPYLLDKTKTYRARFLFGVSTDTLDTTGKTVATTDVVPDEKEIIAALKCFTGKIEQVPPNYSAKCVNGKRGYQLARRGVEFSLAAKTVEITDFSLIKRVSEKEYEFEITCKGGTYIRSLARDLGEKCASLAIMSGLTRTASGKFTLDNSVSVDELLSSATPEKFIIPADFAVDYEKLVLTESQAKKILDGVYEDYGFNDGVYRVYNGSDFWGIGETKEGRLKIKAYVR
ncbi:MAG: tRNA pseudouridine(55) synthase TruB [Clostridia bacterium]|nr:tRNA pseudouridine(55) synthase TruB [Clostridia bacterium]